MKAKYSLWAAALIGAAVMLALVVPAFGASAALSNVTAVGSPSVYRIGDTITYVLTVRNESAHNDAVLDINFTHPNGSVEQLEDDRSYGPGEESSYIRTYVVQADDVGPVAGGRRGVVSYLNASGLELEDGETVDIVNLTMGRTSFVIEPALSIVKTVDANSDGEFSSSEACYVGSSVDWKIVVTNTGDSALTGVTVTDSNGMTFGSVSLAAGVTQTFLYDTVVGADTVNVATVTGLDQLQNTVGPFESTAHVTTVARPEIAIKTYVDFDGDGVFDDESESNLRGSDAVWKVVVSNNGAGILYNVVVTDGDGNPYPLFDLAPGESREFLFDDAGLDGDKVLVATATGLDGFEAQVGPVSDAAALTIFDYFDMELTKTAQVATASAGDEVIYTLTYVNNSTTSVSGFTITDDFDERYMDVLDAAGGTVNDGVITWTFEGVALAPGESGSIIYRLEVISTMPIGLTQVGNTALVRLQGDQDSSNDSDDFNVEVDEPFLPFTPEKVENDTTPTVTPTKVTKTPTEEPFLPFTGSNALTWVLAMGLALLGMYLRSRAQDCA